MALLAEKLAVPDVDGLFISKRDGKLLLIVYGKPLELADGVQNVVAYKQEGVDGKRLVGFSMGTDEEVDQARFDELAPKK